LAKKSGQMAKYFLKVGTEILTKFNKYDTKKRPRLCPESQICYIFTHTSYQFFYREHVYGPL
jgi:hypothetical protein